MPLLLRGARQVGKTYVVEKFGLSQFENLVTINFELQSTLTSCFINLEPKQIVMELELKTNQSIKEGKTLLFFDEVQECSNAILAMRYFKEKMPKLHVIAAGSLLEFTLNAPDFRMPVGRIQFLYLKPMIFKEFLLATGKDKLFDYINQITLQSDIPEVIHLELLSLLRHFLIIGGMPAAVQTFVDTHSLLDTQRRQSDLITSFKKDFGKYDKKANVKYLDLLFNKSPYLITEQFKYVKVSADIRSRDLKDALECLILAGILHKSYATSAKGLPLNALINEKKFKLLFLDVGLVVQQTQLAPKTLMDEKIILINRGAIAEQFVGQELLASDAAYVESKLYFWARAQKNSQAEVDYIINVGPKIYPIEVKAGKTGRLKSLKILMTENKLPIGLKISEQNLSKDDSGIYAVPLYLVSEIRRLVDGAS